MTANNATPSAPVAGLVLLPCPFCGAPAKEFGWRDHYGCSDETCGAYAANLTRPHWNRRAANRTPAYEQLLALVEKLDQQLSGIQHYSSCKTAQGEAADMRSSIRAALAAAQGLTTPEPHKGAGDGHPMSGVKCAVCGNASHPATPCVEDLASAHDAAMGEMRKDSADTLAALNVAIAEGSKYKAERDALSTRVDEFEEFNRKHSMCVLVPDEEHERLLALDAANATLSAELEAVRAELAQRIGGAVPKSEWEQLSAELEKARKDAERLRIELARIDRGESDAN